MDKNVKGNGGNLVVYRTDICVRLGTYTIDLQGSSRLYENELNSMYRFGDRDSKNVNVVTKMEYDAIMVCFQKQCRKVSIDGGH